MSTHKSAFLPLRSPRGVALVITLVAITLISIVLIAFLLQTRLHRMISFSSAGQSRAEFLARASLDTIVGDIQGEIAAGSTIDTQYGVSVYRPLTSANAVPFRSGTLSIGPNTSLVKWSAAEVSAWPQFTGTAAPGPVRASSNNSTRTPSVNGRYIDPIRWAKPLLVPGLSSTFAPDWVLFTRQGAMTLGNSNTLPSSSVLSDASPSNMNYVVGRYAFVVYDVGGLLDITVAGHSSNNLAAADISRGGSTILADLTQIPGLPNQSDIDRIVAWRNAYTASNTTNYGNLIFGSTNAFLTMTPTNSYLTVTPGDQTFLGRQDLLNYWTKQGLNPSALQYLTVFSRDLNAPSYVPATMTGSNGYSYPQLPDSSKPTTSINVDVMKVRFAQTGTFNTSDSLVLLEKNVSVKQGDPLLRRRFPLDRLGWLGLNGPAQGASAADIKQAFGLVWDKTGLCWIYTSPDASGNTAATSIKTLSQVAALSQLRDPDFFELLKAGILNGSLAKVAGDPTATPWTSNNNPLILSGPNDSSSDLQLIQIGANIIDQSGTSNIPTAIAFDDGVQRVPPGPQIVYGTKSLPYLFALRHAIFRPEQTMDPSSPPRSDIGIWLIPDFWDPYQNGVAATSYNPNQFRIRGVQGQMYTQLITGTSTSVAGTRLVPTSAATANVRTLSNLDSITFVRSALSGSAATGAPAGNNFVNPAILNPALGLSNTMPMDNQSTSGTAGWWNGIATTTIFPHSINRERPVQKQGFVGFCAGVINQPDFQINGSGSSTPQYPYTVQRAYVLFNGTTNKPIFEMQCFDGLNWRTYQRWEYVNFQNNSSYTSSDPTYCYDETPVVTQFMWLIDPRTTRFGGQSQHAMPGSSADVGLWWPTTYGPSGNFAEGDITNAAEGIMGGGPGWLPQTYSGNNIMSAYAPASHQNVVGPSLAYNTPQQGIISVWTGSPQNSTIAAAYQDRDGVLRPGDAAVGCTSDRAVVVPMRTNLGAPTYVVKPLDRPVILNRPFRSVGELGYAFRGQPWKSIDFFSANSADAGLLDLFSVSDTTLTAGRVSLNSPYSQVLASILSGALQTELYSSGTNNSSISATGALQLSGSLTTISGTSPFVNRSEVVTKLAPMDMSTASYSISNPALGLPPQKPMREALVRALGDTTTTRTWNLMIDVIAQAGRYTSGENSNFVVEGERRYWLHVAIDRYTGKVIGQKLEAVDE